MKTIILLPFIILAVLTSAFAGEPLTRHAETIASAYYGATIVSAAYALVNPASAEVASVVTAIKLTKIDRKAQIKAAKELISDAQNFYQTGNASLRLQMAIGMMRDKSSELSDAEAIDELVSAAQSLF